MEPETIKAVRAAEVSAEENERRVAAECEDMIKKAREEAGKTISAVITEAKSHAETAAAAARQQSDEMICKAVEEARQDVLALKKVAASKKDKAVRLIISQLTE